MIIGKILVSYSLDLIVQVKVNIKLCNGLELININLVKMTHIVFTELMLI